MSTLGLVLGSLDKPAEFRTSKNGNQFATFAIRENVNGKTRWWRVITFAEDVVDALKEMTPGTPISAAGEIDGEIWSPSNGEARINWRLTCTALISSKAKRRPKLEKAPKRAVPTGRAIASKSWASPAAPQTGGAAPLDDSIPFAPEWR